MLNDDIDPINDSVIVRREINGGCSAAHRRLTDDLVAGGAAYRGAATGAGGRSVVGVSADGSALSRWGGGGGLERRGENLDGVGTTIC